MQKVFKYGTGQQIPENAVYLSTQVETKAYAHLKRNGDVRTVTENNFVWHYFLVEVPDF